jgi:WD40 repeat protein/Tfp pilus assembly protein PilF
VCAGLEAAHQHGVVHRDLKPANILLADDRPLDETLAARLPKIADFGLAKQLDVDFSDIGQCPTQTGAVLGTPSYMAPEQAAGNRPLIGPLSDVYALGAILYESLTGRPPFQGQTPLDTIQQVLTDEPLAPSRLQKVPRDLDTICLKCLEKNPIRRYASAAALADDLRRFQAGDSIVARPVGTIERAWRWSRRNPGWASMWASLILSLVIGVIGLLIGLARMGEALGTAKQNLDRATTAEQNVQRRYVDALLAQAQANRRGRRPGQRFESLRLVNEASERAGNLELADQWSDSLCNAAINALAMPDLYAMKKWYGYPVGSTGVGFDETLTHYARTDKYGNCAVCRVEDGKEIVVRRLPGLGVNLALFSPYMSPDGRFVAVLYTDGRMQMWNLQNSSPEPWLEMKEVEGSDRGRGPFLDFSAGSKHAVLAHVDGRITHLDLEARKSTTFAASELSQEVTVAMHPTELLVAVSSYHEPNVVQVRDLRSGEVRLTLPQPRGTDSCAWRPDGRRFVTAGADGGTIRTYDLASGRLIREFGPCGGGARLAFNHAGDRIAEIDGWTGQLSLWDATAGRQLCVNPSATVHMASIRFSADDHWLGGGTEGAQLALWKVGEGREYRTLVRLAMPASEKYVAPAVHPGGRLLAVAMTDGVSFWDLDSGEELRFLRTGPVRSLVFQPSGTLLITGPRGTWHCPIHADATATGGFHIGSARPLRPFEGLKGSSISISNHNGIIAVASRSVVASSGAWLAKAGSDQPYALHPDKDIAYTSVSPNGRWVVTAEHAGKVLSVWDVNTLAQMNAPAKEIPVIGGYARFSPDGRWLATSTDGGRLWRVGSNVAEWSPGPQLDIADGNFEFSPDGRILALPTRHGQIRLFDVENQRILAELEDPELHATTLAFSPDGATLVAVHVDAVHVWDLRRIRAELVEIGQDWSLPSYPPLVSRSGAMPSADTGNLARVRVEVVLSKISLGIGRMAAAAGRRDTALAAFSRAVRFRPDDEEARLYRGEEYLRRQKWGQAIADLDRAAEVPDLRLTALFDRSLAFAQLGRLANAEDDRRLLGKAYPDFAKACYQQAFRLARAGDVPMALVLVDVWAQLKAGQPIAANDIAWTLANDRTDARYPARALPFAQRAVALRPTEPSCRNTLGVVLYRLGRYAEAKDCFQPTPKAEYSGAALDLYCLAMCEAKMGRAIEAKRYFERADAWRDSHPSRTEVQTAEQNDFRAEAATVLAQANLPRAKKKP